MIGDKLVIENSMEDTLRESPVSSKEGETVSMTFESSQEMTAYICPYYSVQMVGTILCTKY